MNPRQGIETVVEHRVDWRVFLLRRKTVNPRQGIETKPALNWALYTRICRKTVNPRQGIETLLLTMMRPGYYIKVGRQ